MPNDLTWLIDQIDELHGDQQWRTGRKVGRTIYRIRPALEHDQHPLIGVMDRPGDAALVCALVNAWPTIRDALRTRP